MAAFGRGPIQLDSIRVRLSANVIADRVLHGLMRERQRPVCTSLARLHGRFTVGVIIHESPQRLLVPGLHHLGRHLVRGESFAPTTGVLPTGPRPVNCLRTDFGMFLGLEPR